MKQLLQRVFGSIWGGMATGAILATVVLLPAAVSAQNEDPLKISVESQKQGQTNQWSSANTANPGDTMRYIINYQNVSNAEQKQVVVKDVLPAGTSLVPGSTTLFNASDGDGVKVGNDAITGDGIVIGDYKPGANAYVTFEAKLPDADKLACGDTKLSNKGSIIPQGGKEYSASSVTTIKRECQAQNTPTPQPTYSCDMLTVTKAEGRKITAKVNYTAKDGATLKMVAYDFGDGSQPLSTDKTSVDYTYAKDGTYKVTASLTVMAGGKEQKVTSATCAQAVAIVSAAATATPPASPASGPLPSTGPEHVIGIFFGATVLGVVGHHVLMRRLAR